MENLGKPIPLGTSNPPSSNFMAYIQSTSPSETETLIFENSDIPKPVQPVTQDIITQDELYKHLNFLSEVNRQTTELQDVDIDAPGDYSISFIDTKTQQVSSRLDDDVMTKVE